MKRHSPGEMRRANEQLSCSTLSGLAEAVFFSSNGANAPATEALYKKAVVLAPGYFGHVDPAHGQIHAQLLAGGVQELRKELGETSSAPLRIFCLTAAPLRFGESAPEIPTCCVVLMHFSPRAATCSYFANASCTR